MSRFKRLMAPRTWDTPDARGFRAYAKQHYHQMMDLAVELAREHHPTQTGYNVLVPCFFEKLAAPLIYLYESWEVLPPEEKAKYSEELAKIHEETKKLAEKAFK